MSVPEIQNEPCDCPVGKCAESSDGIDSGQCINRLTGDVRVLLCGVCVSHTWHQSGNCLRCRVLTK